MSLDPISYKVAKGVKDQIDEAKGAHTSLKAKLDSMGSGGSGILTFNTVEELQAAYPNGHTTPVWITSENAWYYWDGQVVEEPEPPVDTTAPILTITAGGTFTGTKTITMSVNETADIFYTLDGSTPTTSSAKYTAPLPISATTTLKAFARDTAGNSSAIQTVVYTLDETPPAEPTPPENVTNLRHSNLTDTSLTLIWDPSNDVQSYDIEKNGVFLANTQDTFLNVDNLTPNTQYSFVVKAKNEVGLSSGVSLDVTTKQQAVIPEFSTEHLQVWLDASNISGVANGGKVETWNDLSGKGNHASQTSSTLQPMYQDGSVVFDGSKVMQIKDFNEIKNLDGITIFTVSKANSITAGQFNMLIHKGSTQSTSFPNLSFAVTYRNNGDFNGITSVYFDGSQIDTFRLSLDYKNRVLYTSEQSADGTFKNYLNGEMKNSSKVSGGFNFDNNDIGIGGTLYGARYLDGEINEILIFNSILSDEDKGKVHNYLNDKWGLS